MLNELLLLYLRKFKIDYGKQHIEKFVKLPLNKLGIDFKGSYGIRYLLDLTDRIMVQIFIHGSYEKNTVRQVLKLLQPNMTFVDVGANIGTYTLTLSKFLPYGKVISFEPNPKAIKYLKQNIALNNCTNITVEELGLSDQEGEAILYTTSMTEASIYKQKNAAIHETIKLSSLDTYCKNNNIDHIDVLKIDIEGHEVKCLKGAEEIIRKSKKMILILEIDDNCKLLGIEKNELFNSIIKQGFRGFQPRGYPFTMREIKHLDESYADNIIFVKG